MRIKVYDSSLILWSELQCIYYKHKAQIHEHVEIVNSVEKAHKIYITVIVTQKITKYFTKYTYFHLNFW